MEDVDNNRELDTRAIERLEAGTMWLITEVTGRLFADPEHCRELYRELLRRHRVTLYATPKLGERRNRLRYIIKSRGIHYDTELLESAGYGGAIYEYWLLMIGARSWAPPRRGVRFMVTRTPEPSGLRVVVRSEQRFFDRYEVGGSVALQLDLAEPILRDKLRVSDHPQAYQDYPELTKR